MLGGVNEAFLGIIILIKSLSPHENPYIVFIYYNTTLHYRQL